MGHVESAERDIEVHDQEEEDLYEQEPHTTEHPKKASIRPELPEKQRVEQLRERVQEQIEQEQKESNQNGESYDQLPAQDSILEQSNVYDRQVMTPNTQ